MALCCPLCKRLQFKVAHKGIREDPERPVFRCGNCGLYFIENRLGDLHRYYAEEYRKTHEVLGHSDPALAVEDRFQVHAARSRDAAEDFREFVPVGGSVLEIGCATGGLLSHLYKDYECYGSEWNPTDAAFVREVGELPCEEGDILDIYPGKKFTAIIAIHVLEHQADPVEFLRQCKSRLIGGGYLFLEVPNLRNSFLSVYQLKKFARVWFHEAHLTYWSDKPLGGLLATMGFEARVWGKQRTGIVEAIHYLTTEKPEMPYGGSFLFRPVEQKHPASYVLNRIWGKLDNEYRIQMETLQVTDVLRAMARRQEI